MNVADDEKERKGSDRCENSGDGEHGAIAEVQDQRGCAQIEDEAADAGGGSSHAGDAAYGGVGEQIAGERLDVADPHLKAEEHNGNAYESGVGALRVGCENSKWHKAGSDADGGFARGVDAETA